MTKHFNSEDLAGESVLAGNDILLVPEDIGGSIRGIKKYVAEGKAIK